MKLQRNLQKSTACHIKVCDFRIKQKQAEQFEDKKFDLLQKVKYLSRAGCPALFFVLGFNGKSVRFIPVERMIIGEIRNQAELNKDIGQRFLFY